MQLDEMGFPVLLAAALAERFAVGISALVGGAQLFDEPARDFALSSPITGIRKRSPGPQIGTDFLQPVRFGLRRADDPLIRASAPGNAWTSLSAGPTRTDGKGRTSGATSLSGAVELPPSAAD